MNTNPRRYARHVVAFHLLLLVLVVATVLLAWRAIYATAQDQAKLEAQRRQEVLTAQTVRAIQGYYLSILSDLSLLGQASDAASRREALILSPILWNHLTGRLSHLIVLDRASHRILFAHQAADAPPPEQVVETAQDWLRSVDRPRVSPYQPITDGATLLALPSGANDDVLLVAVIPMAPVRREFLSDIDSDRGIGAMLVDQSGHVMSSPEQDLIGQSILGEEHDPRIATAIVDQIRANQPGTEFFDAPLDIGQSELPSSIVTIYPINITGERWWLVLGSTPQEVEAIVNAFFDQAIFWGIFVILAVSAILVSTSVQLIRGRIRLERLQHEILQQELTQARLIQITWLPQQQGDFGICDIAAINHPASHISGDFYNWFKLPDGRMAVVIGDVTGHGMAAAFLMATTQLLMRSTIERTGDPGPCLTQVNRELTRQIFRGQFVTMLVLVIDAEQQCVHVSSAGHPPPLVGTGASFERLPITSQLVLGVDEDVEYETATIPLTQGSNVLLYTDGVTDVQAASGERFSEEGLQRSLAGTFRSAGALLNAALDAVNTFRGGSEPGDDLTFVALRVTYREAPRTDEPAREMVSQP